MIAATTSIVGNLFIFLMIGAALIVGIVSSLCASRAAAQRSRDLWALAQRLSFDNFTPGRDKEFAAGWGFLGPLDQGQERYAFNILRGTYHEQSLFIFDYHFQTGSGKQKQEHYCTILMLVFKEVFPRVSIGPESWGRGPCRRDRAGRRGGSVRVVRGGRGWRWWSVRG